MSIVRILAAALLASSLNACASNRFEADVVRFHRNDVAEVATVSLRPADPNLAQTLEFQSYAEILGQRLASHGFRPAANGAADLIGEVGYVTATRSALRDGRSSSPVSVGVGVGGVGSNVGVSVGTAFGIGGGKSKGGTRVHTLSLRLMQPDGATVWEGRAVAEVSTDQKDDLPSVFPRLADALLSDFPGPSGTTTRYVEPSGR